MFGVTGRCVASILSSGRCRLPGRGSILPKSPRGKSPREPETLFRVWRFVGLSRMVGSGQLRLFHFYRVAAWGLMASAYGSFRV